MKSQLAYIGLLAIILLGVVGFLQFQKLSSSAAETAPVQVYKWQDEEGTWHFSEEQPDNQHEVVTIQEPTIVQLRKPQPVVEEASRGFSLPFLTSQQAPLSPSSEETVAVAQTPEEKKRGRVIRHHGGPFPTATGGDAELNSIPLSSEQEKSSENQDVSAKIKQVEALLKKVGGEN